MFWRLSLLGLITKLGKDCTSFPVLSRSIVSSTTSAKMFPFQSTFYQQFSDVISSLPLKVRDETFQSLREVYRQQPFLASMPMERAEFLFENLYWILYCFIKSQYLTLRADHRSLPLVIGLSAPQGSGKTTFTETIQRLFEAEGINLIFMSLDDFYLRGREQDLLRQNNPENDLLKYRGNAGTHDVNLLYETLSNLKASYHQSDKSEKEQDVFIPRYDKSLRGGLGDRAPRDQWTQAKKPIDIVLLEGWMLGFSAKESLTRDDTAMAISAYQRLYPHINPNQLHRSLESLNSRLVEYEKIDQLMDGWIIYEVSDVNVVYTWRLQAEHQMKALKSKNQGLSDEQVKDFVARFMPAYYTYLPALYRDGPKGARSRTSSLSSLPAPAILKLAIDADRMPISLSRISLDGCNQKEGQLSDGRN